MKEFDFKDFIGKKVIKENGLNLILVFEDNNYLTIECFWRLRGKNIILLTSRDYEDGVKEKGKEEKLINYLIDQKIISINFISHVSDLVLEFENGLILEVYNDSKIFESWTLSNEKGFLLVSLPGGEFTYSSC